VRDVAQSCGAPLTAVALSWLLGRPGVSSAIIGPKTLEQWRDNLAACELRLPPEALKKLDDASVPAPTYPEAFIMRALRNSGVE
jgi:aryl-alcohol dehydrogenase-like predicted oxidoreductase